MPTDSILITDVHGQSQAETRGRGVTLYAVLYYDTIEETEENQNIHISRIIQIRGGYRIFPRGGRDMNF